MNRDGKCFVSADSESAWNVQSEDVNTGGTVRGDDDAGVRSCSGSGCAYVSVLFESQRLVDGTASVQ
jgi:hypothetical protein